MTQVVRVLFWWGRFWWRGYPTSDPNQATIWAQSGIARRSCASDAATRVVLPVGSGRMSER